MINENEYQAALARTERRNAEFSRMTDREKRLTVAKDVLNMLQLEQIAASGLYFTGFYEHKDNFGAELDATIMSQTRKGTACQVCAVGAVFVSTARNMALRERPDDATGLFCAAEGGGFSFHQLKELEGAFELWAHGLHRHLTPLVKDRRWIDLTRQQRLVRIMENIVRNDGDFIFEQEIR